MLLILSCMGSCFKPRRDTITCEHGVISFESMEQGKRDITRSGLGSSSIMHWIRRFEGLHIHRSA